MATHFTDSFSLRIGSTGENPSRVASVAWLIAAHEDASLLNWNPNDSDFRKNLKEYVNKDSGAGIFIRGEMLKRLVPQKCVDWIYGDRRQLSWINNYISKIDTLRHKNIIKDPFPMFHMRPNVKPHYLLDLNMNVAFVDYWLVKSFSDMSTAIRHCGEMEVAWRKLTESDKLFSWVDGADAEKKRECFWEFLKNKHPNDTNDYQKFMSHEDLLIFFDDPFFARDTKELYSQHVRKTWNQRVRRENSKDRKQCNFLLPQETIEKLEKLAKKHGVSRTEIIQILIESEHKKNVHISERLSRKLQLMTPHE